MKNLFVCHGNICRSAAAEMVTLKLLEDRGLTGRVTVDSAATSAEELGCDVYPPMKRALGAAGVPCRPHQARQTVRGDYGRYDHIICMDHANYRRLLSIYGGDPQAKLSLLSDWAGHPGREIDDPWYTGEFDKALRQIMAGCEGLLTRVTAD